MTAQEVKFANFFETTLNGILASGATAMTLTAAPTSDGTSAIAAPYYLVIDPDNASNREVVEVTAASGTIVRMAVVSNHIADQNDRITAKETSLQTDFDNLETSLTSTINTALASKPSIGIVIALS